MVLYKRGNEGAVHEWNDGDVQERERCSGTREARGSCIREGTRELNKRGNDGAVQERDRWS